MLSLNGTEVGEAGLAYLIDLKKLGVLYVNGTRTTDAGLAYFEQMTELQGTVSFLHPSNFGILSSAIIASS